MKIIIGNIKMIIFQAFKSFSSVVISFLLMFFQILLGGLGLRYMDRVGAREHLEIGVIKIYDTAKFLDKLYYDGKSRRDKIRNRGSWIMIKIMDFHLMTIKAYFPIIRWAIQPYIDDNLKNNFQIIWLNN